jgi:hypothetical protein
MTGREGDDRPGCVGRSRLASSDICGAEHREANLFAERNATVVSRSGSRGHAGPEATAQELLYCANPRSRVSHLASGL